MTTTTAAAASVADIMNSVAALLWVAIAAAALVILRRVIRHSGALTKFSLGPTGVSMDFAEAKLQQAIAGADQTTQDQVGHAARRTVLVRMQRNAKLLAASKILWVDDHPEYNTPIVELLRKYGAAVETPTTNVGAMLLLGATRYDAVISDVGRDSEGPNSAMMGVEFAKAMFEQYAQRPILFSARFNPASVPGLDPNQRLELVAQVQNTVFGTTNRMDELLHLVLDVLERL